MGQLLGVGLLVLAHFVLPFDRPPLAPWQRLGSSAYVEVFNLSEDTLAVTATAPKVDEATRALGCLPPCGHALLRLPYADTDVTVTAGSTVTTVHVDGPKVWQIAAIGREMRCLTGIGGLLH